jgi:hypothetical protein
VAMDFGRRAALQQHPNPFGSGRRLTCAASPPGGMARDYDATVLGLAVIEITRSR